MARRRASSSNARDNRRPVAPARAIFPAAGLIAAGLLTYGNSLWGAFVHDDVAIQTYSFVRQLWPPSAVLNAPADSPPAGRPLAAYTLAVNYAAGGLDPFGYHLVNLAIHLLAALTLFGVVRRTLSSEPLAARFEGAAPHVAFGTALLWLVHPLQTEAVNYISQRTESLMGLCYLSTLYCAIRAREMARSNWWLAAVAACAAGMASKETMVTAPIAVLLYDWAFRVKPFGEVLRERVRLYAGLAATWVVLGALMAGGPRAQTVGLTTGASPFVYLLNQAPIIAHYLRMIVWPAGLTIDYGVPLPLSIGEVLPAALLVVVLLAASVIALFRWPPVGFPMIWVFLTLAPTSSIVPIATEVGADRRMYLPLAGIAALVAAGVFFVIRRFQAKANNAGSNAFAAAGALLAIAVPFGAVSASRNLDYRSEIELLKTSLAVRPHAGVYNNLGVLLTGEGKYTDAIAALRESLRLEPESAKVHRTLGYNLDKTGDRSGAIQEYREALRIAPNDFDAHKRLGDLLLATEQFDEAASHLRRYLDSRPNDDAEARTALGLALLSSGHVDEALMHCRRAVELAPNLPFVRFNFGLALALAGRTAEAQEQLRIAGDLDPELRGPALELLKQNPGRTH